MRKAEIESARQEFKNLMAIIASAGERQGAPAEMVALVRAGAAMDPIFDLAIKGLTAPEGRHAGWRYVESDVLPEGSPVVPGRTLYCFTGSAPKGYWVYDLPSPPQKSSE